MSDPAQQPRDRGLQNTRKDSDAQAGLWARLRNYSAADWRKRIFSKRTIGNLLIAIGVLVIIDVAVTLAWKEPLTAINADRQQRELQDELARTSRLKLKTGQIALQSEPTSDRGKIDQLAETWRDQLKPGAAAGEIRIKRLGLKAVVVGSDGRGDLAKGPGFYPSQPLPGQPGTAAIAGHRTTYSAPFRNVDKLRNGDAIQIQMPYASLRYEVFSKRSVTADQVWVLKRRGYDQLVLTACDPPFSAARRLVIFAKLKSSKIRTVR